MSKFEVLIAAARVPTGFFDARDIASDLDISQAQAKAVLRQLTREGLVYAGTGARPGGETVRCWNLSPAGRQALQTAVVA